MEGSLDLNEKLETDALSLIGSIEDAVLVTDLDGEILKTNERFEEITGYTEEDLAGENAQTMAKKIIKDEDEEIALKVLGERSFEEKLPDPIEINIESKGGEERYINLRVSLIEDEEWEKSLNVAIAREITEEKERERTLEKSRKKYRKILEVSPEGIVVHRDGKLQYINPSGAGILGMEDRDEHIGKSIMKVVHPDYREKVKERVKKMTEEGKSVPLIEEKFVRVDNGEDIDVEVAAAPIEIEGETSVQVIFRDVSDRKKAEIALKQRERKVRDLYESTVKFERCKFKEDVFEVALESAKNILDFYSSSIHMVEDDDLVIKATTDDEIEEGRRFPSDGGIRGLTYQNYESYLIDDLSGWEEAKPTNEKFESVISVPIGDVGVFQALSDEKGHYDEFDLEMARGLATHIKEAADRIKAEKELKEREAKFRSLFEASPDAIYWIDEDGYIQDVNRVFEEKLGYEKEKIIGKHFTDAWFVDEEYIEKMKEKKRRRMEGEDVDPYTIKIVDNQGDAHYSELNVHQVKEEEGDRGKIVVSRDITERKRAEEKLRASEKKFRGIFEATPDPVFLLDDDGNFVDVNESALKRLGFKKGEIIGSSLWDAPFFPDETIEKTTRKFEKRKEGKEVPPYPVELKCKNGERITVEVNVGTFEDDHFDGEIVIARDITERKGKEEELKKSREKYRLLTEEVNDLILLTDLEGKCLFANKAHKRLLSYEPEEIIGREAFEFIHPDDREWAKEKFMEGLKKGHGEGQVRIQTKNGSSRWVEFHGRLTPNKEKALIVNRDITERKKTEEKLRKSKERYQLLTEEVNDLISLIDLDGVYQFANKAHKRILGYEPEDLIGKNSFEKIHPDDRDWVKEVFKRGIKEGHAEGEARVRTKDGSYRWIETHGRFIPDEDKALIVNRDITERKKREERIEHLNSLLRSIREVNQLITKEEDVEEIMEEASTLLRETRDYSKVSIMLIEAGKIDLHIGDLDVTRIEGIDDKIEELRATKEPLMISKDEGAGRRVLVPLIDKEMEGILVVDIQGEVDDEELDLLEDIASDLALAKTKKETEKELKRSLKEKTVLLDEINHRVKNNMQVISSMLTLQAEKEEDEEAARVLQEGQRRIQSMALIHEMLYRSEDMAEIDLADYIDELVGTLCRSYGIDGERIELEMDLEDIKLGINKANPLAQVLNEVISNSLEHAFPEAYEDQGKLNISTSLSDDQNIEVVVSDNGVGVPEHIDLKDSKTFGLRLINMLVEDQLGGKIEVEKDGGTTFKIEFERE